MSCNYRVSEDVAGPSLPRAKASGGIGNELRGSRPRELGRTREGLRGEEGRLGATTQLSPLALSKLLSTRADPAEQSRGGAGEAGEAQRKAAEPRTRL